MRILGLDIGLRRIGLAICDPSGVLASPLGFINRTHVEQDLDRISSLTKEQGAELIVAGIPMSLGGRKGPQAQSIESFVETLSQYSPIPVETWDESYSTTEAENLLREAGHKPSLERGRVDAAAATIILQRYLDNTRIR